MSRRLPDRFSRVRTGLPSPPAPRTSGHGVDGVHADALRRARGVLVHYHDSGERLPLRHRSRVSDVGAGLAKAGDRHINHAGIGRRDRVVCDAQALDDAGPEILEKHVAPCASRTVRSVRRELRVEA